MSGSPPTGPLPTGSTAACLAATLHFAKARPKTVGLPMT